MTPQQLAELFLQSKELIALLALLSLIWFIMTKHIPMLLIREEKKQELDRQLQRENNQAIVQAVDKLDGSVEKMGAFVGQAIEHLGELMRELSRRKDQEVALHSARKEKAAS